MGSLANCLAQTVESEVPVLSPALLHHLLGPLRKHNAMALGRHDKKCPGCASVENHGKGVKRPLQLQVKATQPSINLAFCRAATTDVLGVAFKTERSVLIRATT